MKNFKLIKALINNAYLSFLFNFCVNDCFSMTGDAGNRPTKLHRVKRMSRLNTQYNKEPHNTLEFDEYINKINEDEKCQKLNKLGKVYRKKIETDMENQTNTFNEQLQEYYNQHILCANVGLVGKDVEEQKIINTLPNQEQLKDFNDNHFYTPASAKKITPYIRVCRERESNDSQVSDIDFYGDDKDLCFLPNIKIPHNERYRSYMPSDSTPIGYDDM